MKRNVLSGLCLVILFSGLLSPRFTEIHRNANPLVIPMVEELEAFHSDEDKIDERLDWFYFQRAYPFEDIPDEARRRAFLSRPARFDESDGLENLSATIWESIGPSPTRSAFMNNWGLTSGRINAIAVSPHNPNIILIGSATGGIFRSGDGGVNFEPVTDNQVDLAVSAIAFAKSNPSVVYAGLGDYKSAYFGTGVLKSTDAGRSWVRVNSDGTLPTKGQAADLAVDPNDANRIYLAQYARLNESQRFSSGFYLSTDGGISWTKTLTGLPRDLVLDVSNSRTLYLGVARVDSPANTPAGLYRSTDGGLSWTRIFTTPYDLNRTADVRIAVTPAAPQNLYVYSGGVSGTAARFNLYISTNGGNTFGERVLTFGNEGIDPAQFGYNTYLHVDPSDANTIYIGSRDVFKSVDGGLSWTNKTKNFRFTGSTWGYFPNSSNAHPDQHALWFSELNSRELLIGNDGGIFKSSNGGDSFSSLNSTLNLTMFTSLATHPTNPAVTYGGTQDNGTQRRTQNGNQWQEFFSGDGGRVVINPLDPSVVFTTYVRNNIYRFSNNTASFDYQVGFDSTFGESSSSPRVAFYPPFTGNNLDQTLYFGTWRLFISEDDGNNWIAPAGDLDLTKGNTSAGIDVLTAIGVGPANKNIIYTGSRQGRAMVSTDAGLTWSEVTAGLPNRSISTVYVDPANSEIAYLSLSGYGSGHIFKTTNIGQTWTDISGNLPDIPASAFIFDPLNPNIYFLGTDIGVFRSGNGGTNWDYYNKGMPPAIVTAFSSQKSGLIQVATYGRGAFQIDRSLGPVISSAVFQTPKVLIITGSNFGRSPKVIINDVDQSSFIRASGDTSIKLKGKAKNMGIKAGDNTIKIVNEDLESRSYTLSY
ncbi:MAG: hypothetical protein AB1757_15255 [Acidobacteriota bacterium]